MTQLASRGAARRKRHDRIRLHLAGTDVRPRLAVFRSLNHIYAQVIDDSSGRTLAAASSLEPDLKSAKGTKSAEATAVGRIVAERARAAGVGYRAAKAGEKLQLNLGYSHQIEIDPPAGISFEIESPTRLAVVGIDKELVGQIAAKVRSTRKPEPYKGKGVRYAGEKIRRKAGKAGKFGGKK